MYTSCPYRDLEDLRGMLQLLMEARSLTGDWRYPHLGDLLWQFLLVERHLGARRHIRLWHDGPRLAGYAVLAENPLFEWQVHPDYERQGIQQQAWEWAQTLINEMRRLHPQDWDGPCVSGSRQDDLERVRFLERIGFRPGGDLSEVNLVRELDGAIPELPIPPGCQVRPVQDGEEVEERAAALRDVWLPWSDGNVSTRDYAFLRSLPGFSTDLDMALLLPEGAVAAFTIGYLDPLNRVGVLGDVGCRPAFRRQGYTRLVVLEVLRRMQAHGMRRCLVSTNNEPAIRLYESVGFRLSNRYIEYVLEK